MQQAFQITFQLESCMQIGAGSLGMIEKTSLFIPKRIIWAAFTNTLTLMKFDNPSHARYVEIGNALANASISSFFPFIRDTLWIPFIPERKFLDFNNPQKAFITFNDMEASALTSVTATALNPESMSAKNGTLHAVDLIKPVFDDKNAKRLPFRFSGFLALPDVFPFPLSDSEIKKIFSLSTFGGGRKRGWGRVFNVSVSKVKSFPGNIMRFPFRNGSIILDSETPVADLPDTDGIPILLSSRIFSEAKGFGQDFTKPALVWTPGSFFEHVS